MHGLVVIEGMTLSGHPWIINEIFYFNFSNEHVNFILPVLVAVGDSGNPRKKSVGSKMDFTSR